MRRVFILLAAGLMALPGLSGVATMAPPAWAQQAAIGADGAGEDDPPIEVLADDGIEWRRDEQVYIARGNAVAIQGDSRVYGDVLVAHYRESAEGTNEIYRMEARGNARIESPERTVTGQTAVYNVDTGILVVRGEPLSMVTPEETVTARDSLEYWSNDRLAVARGDAKAVRVNGDIVEAEVLTGLFAEAETESEGGGDDAGDGAASAPPPAASDGTEGETPAGAPDTGGLERLEAFDNVVIRTTEEVVRGARAVYDVASGMATVVGDVTITTETDQLAGQRAVVDMNTGVSTLHSGDGADGDGRARALIAPQRPAPAPDPGTAGPTGAIGPGSAE
ncbi:LptA/OstA family protein [Roseospira navarrensis]|uniref:Organic solvent tolerance-like N-terminal domain-containing protein n=1 Tax=Roseospira navarrensis TaxID=140058 RepID=A0A7X1ZF83_9PROT|nr:LptA/OstA family protein [Roseospira navarrensis]MQX37483.1 hypothetical protein [Roseospira navarrensis]